MKLNSRAQTAQQSHNNSPIVLVHGLFGSLDNLGVLARDLVTDHDVIQVDMRNHGLSARSPEMTYPAMAQDLLDTLDDLQIEKATFIGHSMGGKAVMALTALAPARIDRLVAIDIAPVDYQVRRHDEIFTAINAVTQAQVSTRQQAAAVMREHLDEEGVIQFYSNPGLTARGALTCRCCGSSMRTSSAGPECRLSINRRCSFAAAILPMSPMRIARRCLRSSRRRGRMWWPVPGTGCMRKNPMPCCGRSAAI